MVRMLGPKNSGTCSQARTTTPRNAQKGIPKSRTPRSPDDITRRSCNESTNETVDVAHASRKLARKKRVGLVSSARWLSPPKEQERHSAWARNQPCQQLFACIFIQSTLPWPGWATSLTEAVVGGICDRHVTTAI
eukprot:2442002-Amphidinium_carterae.2